MSDQNVTEEVPNIPFVCPNIHFDVVQYGTNSRTPQEGHRSTTTKSRPRCRATSCMCARQERSSVDPEDDKIELPPFTPIFNGIMEHCARGMTPTAFSTYCILQINCDYNSGIWRGTSTILRDYHGGKASLRIIQKVLLELGKWGSSNTRMAKPDVSNTQC
jgi:hypothetical protein